MARNACSASVQCSSNVFLELGALCYTACQAVVHIRQCRRVPILVVRFHVDSAWRTKIVFEARAPLDRC